MNPLHYVSYGAAIGGARLLRSLPLGTAQRMAGGVARRLFDRGGRRVDTALTNLRLVFPDLSEEERLAIGRESYVHLAWNVIDVARADAWGETQVREHVDLLGEEHLRAALDQGKGAILLMLHMGNFELSGYRASLAGPCTIVQKPRANPLFDRRIASMRTRYGAESVVHRQVAPKILRALRKGHFVGVLNDQYLGRSRSVLVPFFGARCLTGAGVATLALRSGAPVLPFYIMRDGPDHHRAAFLPELKPPASGDRKRDIETATAGYNQTLEAIIRKHPEQWMWAHRRFRHSPDLPDNPYA